MDLAHIRQRLAAYQPALIDEAKAARAAVAVVLWEVQAGVEILLIQRATRDGDPWSGHVAFPGGRRHPEDRDAVATAVRETEEEIGVELTRDAEVVGRLDDLRAVAARRPLDLLISPVVFALQRPVTLRPNPREVGGALWAPLGFFFDSEAHATYTRRLDGEALHYPAFRYGDYLVWGLTHRILLGLLDIVCAGAPDAGVRGRAAGR